VDCVAALARLDLGELSDDLEALGLGELSYLLLEDEADKRRWYDIELAEEESFHAVLATKPRTRAGAIACVRHVADIGLVTEEVSAWLMMLLGSPRVP